MGKSKQKTEQSSTQDTLRSTQEVSQEFAKSLPQVLSAISEFQPQFTQQALEEFQEFAPQFGQATQDAFAQVSPQQAALRETLAGQALQRSEEGLTAEEREFFRNQFAAEVGSQVNAPIGAASTARNLIQQQLLAKAQGQNLGLQLAQGTPTGQSGFSPSAFSVGSAFSPIFQNAGKVFGSQGQSTTTQTTTPSMLKNITGVMGGVAGLMSGVGAIGGLGALGLGGSAAGAATGGLGASMGNFGGGLVGGFNPFQYATGSAGGF
jgi:Fe2+ transport system protein B